MYRTNTEYFSKECLIARCSMYQIVHYNSYYLVYVPEDEERYISLDNTKCNKIIFLLLGLKTRLLAQLCCCSEGAIS